MPRFASIDVDDLDENRSPTNDVAIKRKSTAAKQVKDAEKQKRADARAKKAAKEEQKAKKAHLEVEHTTMQVCLTCHSCLFHICCQTAFVVFSTHSTPTGQTEDRRASGRLLTCAFRGT